MCWTFWRLTQKVCESWERSFVPEEKSIFSSFRLPEKYAHTPGFWEKSTRYGFDFDHLCSGVELSIKYIFIHSEAINFSVPIQFSFLVRVRIREHEGEKEEDLIAMIWLYLCHVAFVCLEVLCTHHPHHHLLKEVGNATRKEYGTYVYVQVMFFSYFLYSTTLGNAPKHCGPPLAEFGH